MTSASKLETTNVSSATVGSMTIGWPLRLNDGGEMLSERLNNVVVGRIDVVRKRRPRKKQAQVLWHGRAHRERVVVPTPVPRLKAHVDQAARPQPRAPGIEVERDLRIVPEGVAGLDSARRDVLIGRRGVQIQEHSAAGPIRSHPAPVRSHLRPRRRTCSSV